MLPTMFRNVATTAHPFRSAITTTIFYDRVLLHCSSFLRNHRSSSSSSSTTGSNPWTTNHRVRHGGRAVATGGAVTTAAAAMVWITTAASYSTSRGSSRMRMTPGPPHSARRFLQMWYPPRFHRPATTTTTTVVTNRSNSSLTKNRLSLLQWYDTSIRNHRWGVSPSSSSSSSSSSVFQQIQQRRMPQSPFSVRRSLTTPSSSTTTTTSNPYSSTTSKISFMEWYERNLSTHPILTKMVTGSFLWGLGDMVAQLIPQFTSTSTTTTTASEKDDDDDDVTAPLAATLTYDCIRTARAAVFGCFIHAPLSHLHFNFLEYITVQLKFTGYSIPIFKAFMEQFVYWSWISNSIYFAAMGAMQGLNLSQIYHRISEVLWETQVAQWTFWIPIQLINFQYTPVRHQLNVVLITSIVWTALLSMWYPPIQSTEKDGDEKPMIAKEDHTVAQK